MKLSEKIKVLRTMRGITQEQLGSELSSISSNGISRQAVCDWETGKSEPKLNNIRDLKKFFNVSYDILLDDSLQFYDKESYENLLSSIKRDNKATKTINYYFERFVFGKKEIIKIIETILYIGILIFLSLYNFSESINTLIYLLLGICFGLVIYHSIGLFVYFIGVFKKRGEYCGSLDYYELTLNSLKDNKNLYIPIKNIEELKLLKHYKNFIGTIYIKIIDRKEPFILKHIYSPIKLIDTYNEIMGPNTGLDNVEL